VKRIHSHPQAIAQCRNWLAANAAGVEVVEAPSTTRAAETAANEPGAAAIASEAAAAIYDLHVLEACIEDRPDNITRFVVLSHRPAGRSGRDRTSVMFSLQDESGSLADALMIFKEHDVNMTRIESRPARKRAWEYTFFVDMEGHVEDAPVAAALKALEARSHDFVVLGSYPRAERLRPENRPA
jgi:chorismate mutase/prephenate dehydratase